MSIINVRSVVENPIASEVFYVIAWGFSF